MRSALKVPPPRMSCRSSVSMFSHGASATFAQIAEELGRTGFAFCPSDLMRSMFRKKTWADWPAYRSSWDGLVRDRYMADGGRYRRRRFSVCTVSANGIVQERHQPHVQALEFNPLNGGIDRWFAPVGDDIITHDVTRTAILACHKIFGPAAPGAAWRVEMHQIRTETRTGELGKATPEGLHRDGVRWICIVLVNRRNISGALTRICDRDRRPIEELTLGRELDALFLDDERVLHEVTPCGPLEAHLPAFRDVLILTLRKQ